MDQRSGNEGIIRDLFEVNGFAISMDVARNFARFIAILDAWNKKINLTAHGTLEEIVLKDLIDSAYFDMYRIMYMSNQSKIMDLGCGAGFTGITAMILHPELAVCFLDSSRKRINFVRQVLAELELQNGGLHWGRGEEIREEMRGKFDAVVSRASFDLNQFLKIGSQYVQNSAHLFFMAGQEKAYPDVQSSQTTVKVDDIQYVIKPAFYKRRILVFKKEAS